MRRIAAFILLLSLQMMVLLPAPARADDLINLSVRANNTEPGVGDTLQVSIIADNFPGIVSFGPMKIHFDASLAEYVSVELGNDISSFVYNVTNDESYVNISAIDQYYQETGNEEGQTEGAQSAFNTDTSMVLCTISFRIRQDASGQIPFWIEDPGEFIAAGGASVSTAVDNSISVTISNKVSNDASLVDLRLNEAELTPSFSNDITEYTATVERSVTDVGVTATPSNLWAGVIINGNNNLQIGDNMLTVIVTAQDKVTQSEYHIRLTRKESYVPENAVFADSIGNSFTFLDFPKDFEAPEGFVQRIRNVNDFAVPAYVRDGFVSVLLYLYDGENPPGLYLYNDELKTVVPYNSELVVMQKSSVLIRTAVPEDVVIPKDFREDIKTVGGVEYAGYRDAEDRFVCYLSDEAGNAGFYSYDDVDNVFIRYVPVDRTAQKAYSALLTVFMIITGLEALFLIVIVIIVHRVLSHRKNPKPRRV